jgi:hypothetical protein
LARRCSLGVLGIALCLAAGACGGDDAAPAAPRPAAVNATKPDPRLVAQIPSTPGPGASHAPGTHVGATASGTGVAFIVGDDEVIVYLCDGDRASDWFGGALRDGGFDLRSEGGTHITGRIGAGAVGGTVSLAGRADEVYAAIPAAEAAPTGLFVFDDPTQDGLTARWIVSADGIRGVSVSTPAGGAGTTAGSAPAPRASTPVNAISVPAEAGASSGDDVSGLDAQIAAIAEQARAVRGQVQQIQAAKAKLEAARAAVLALGAQGRTGTATAR